MKDKPESLVAKFLDEPEVWVDRFCEKCGKAFRTKMFMRKYFCTECYLGIFKWSANTAEKQSTTPTLGYVNTATHTNQPLSNKNACTRPRGKSTRHLAKSSN